MLDRRWSRGVRGLVTAFDPGREVSIRSTLTVRFPLLV
jgi:hypothetical protein